MVPLWLARMFRKRKLCRIIPPDWMQVGHLRGILEQEREPGNEAFAVLPHHYIEISNILLKEAPEDFGDEGYEVKYLLEDIRVVRFKKLQRGMQSIGTGQYGLLEQHEERERNEGGQGKVNTRFQMPDNLCAIELNLIKGFFTKTMDRYGQIANGVDAANGAPNGYGGGGGGGSAPAETPPTEQAEPVRQLRRQR